MNSGHRRNIESLLGPNVQFVEDDIRDRDLVYRLMADCDGAFHLAALVSVPQSISHRDDSFTINLQGTLNLFEASRGQASPFPIFGKSFVESLRCNSFRIMGRQEAGKSTPHLQTFLQLAGTLDTSLK